MQKLTKRFVESIKPNCTKTVKYWDSELKGFGVVVLPSGRRTYCVQYRNVSRVQKRLKIGVHGQITAEQARAFARVKLSEVVQGKDPATLKQEGKAATTIKDLAQEYLERHCEKKRPKSVKEDKKLLRNLILPAVGELKVALVTKRDVENLHLKRKATPYQANRALALLSKMFELAEDWGLRTGNPVKRIERYPEEKRDRWLNKEELERLWAVLDQYTKNYTAYALKFLILTGARKSEALQATWDQFDLQKGIWTKPSHLTKQKKKEHLPLSEKALSLLRDLKKRAREETSYVFPGRVDGEPLKEIKKFWKKVITDAKLANVRIHDLRHTHASHLVSSGLSLSIVGKLLGHTQASTTQRYAHLADAPLREAAELFGSKVGGGPHK